MQTADRKEKKRSAAILLRENGGDASHAVAVRLKNPCPSHKETIEARVSHWATMVQTQKCSSLLRSLPLSSRLRVPDLTHVLAPGHPTAGIQEIYDSRLCHPV